MTEERTVRVNGIELNVATAGTGPTVLLLHGFPHTWRVWTELIEPLARHHRVLAPDLRGFGGSTRTPDGLDAETLSADVEELLDGQPATVVALDAGVPPAFLLAQRRPDLVDRLVLIEATLGTLPGAEGFFAAGPPWWFGFHAVPGLAETVLAGHEADYVGWFYDQGTRGRGVRPDVRAAIGSAFAEPGALRSALGFYRALPRTSTQIAEAADRGRLTVPTTAIGAAPVGRALEHQLRPICDDLTGRLIPDCGHIVPLDRPHELLAAMDLGTSAAQPSPRGTSSMGSTPDSARSRSRSSEDDQ